MKKYLLLLLLTIGFATEETSNYFVDNFLKYSTFYTSVSLESPYVPTSQWEVDVENGTFVETTKENDLAYNVSIGVRKLARFKYQAKGKKFYDGSEKELSDVATIGAVSGWEYLIKYSTIRSFGEEFVDTESWIRYLGDNFVVKAAYANFGREGLEFGQLDTRWRKSIGSNWNFSLGGNFRGHPAYGLFPFNDWLAGSDGAWWELAYDYDYTDEYYFYDNNENGIQDNDEVGNYNWYENGELVADSDNEFYEYYYGDVINLYNEEIIDGFGYQYQASLVLGVDYYLYGKKYWVHSWVSVMPYNKGLTDYSFKYEKGAIDIDLGLVAGWKFNKNFGMFGEGRYLSYWGIDSYEFKVGFNYTVF